MKTTISKRIIATLTTLCLVVSLFGVTAMADGTKIITMGANLTQEERQKVLDFFGIEDLSQVEEISVNNTEEHETLGGLIPDAQIGTKTYSCAYIEPTSSGGINVRTANLTYVSDSTLANALMTAGITNCNLIVTAPFPVSGTGALTGVYKAYDNMGIALDDEKKEIATEEMIVTSDLEEEHGEEINSVITEIKDEVAGAEDMTDEELTDLIKDTAEDHDITLTDDEIAKILSFIRRISELDYDMDAFKTSVNDALDKLVENSDGIAASIKGFFASIGNFFKNLFGGSSDSDDNSGSGSIFDDINTDIFDFDQ